MQFPATAYYMMRAANNGALHCLVHGVMNTALAQDSMRGCILPM